MMVQAHYCDPVPDMGNRKISLPMGHAFRVLDLTEMEPEFSPREDFLHKEASKIRQLWYVYGKHLQTPSLDPFTVFDEVTMVTDWHCELCHSAFHRFKRQAEKAGTTLPFGDNAPYLRELSSQPRPKPDIARRDALHAALLRSFVVEGATGASPTRDIRRPDSPGGTPPSYEPPPLTGAGRGKSDPPPLCAETLRRIAKGRPLSEVEGVSIMDFSRPSGEIHPASKKEIYDWCCPNCEKVYINLCNVRKLQWKESREDYLRLPLSRKHEATATTPLTTGMPEHLRDQLDPKRFRYITTGIEGKIHRASVTMLVRDFTDRYL